MYLLRDLGGHGDAGLADEGPEESAHGAQVLDVDGAQLGHADQSEVSIASELSANHSSPAVLAVEVVLPLLVGVRQHGVRGAQLLELLSCLLITRVLENIFDIKFEKIKSV